MTNIASTFFIGNKCVGFDQPPYCIAEVGINHNGDLKIAKQMIEIAKKAGADAVKFQTFKASELCADRTQLFTYQSQGETITEPMLDMFERYELSEDAWHQISEYCREIGITFFSTPQNVSDLEILLKQNVPVIKVGSDDFTNTPLLKKYSETGLPLILSCGMSNLAEVHQALDVTGWFSGYPVAVLLCTSQYPTSPEDVNIRKLTTLSNAFPGLLIGFSDHTEGSLAAGLAVAGGAKIFEKHFTLDKKMAGPDHWFSDDFEGLSNWINTIHKADLMLGQPFLLPTKKEQENKKIGRRSISAASDLVAGEIFTHDNLCMLRPGTGLSPSLVNFFYGKKAARNINKGEQLNFSDISEL